jgi:type IX secretion system PorP/SprF family membrane protein
MKKIYPLICLIIALAFTDLKAQDIHFSQFYNTPLFTNPALTGRFNGLYRLNAVYRNQWFQVGNFVNSPFATYGAAVDFSLPQKHNAFGVGTSFFHDQAGNGGLKTTSIAIHAAYHKAFDKGGKHMLSLGMAGEYTNRRLDQGNLQFYNQFNANNQFNPNLPTGENIVNENVSYFDLGAGLFYNGKMSKNLLLYAGGSVFHLLMPKTTFASGDELELQMRWVANGGLDITAKKVSILPSVIYMRQGNINELNTGLSFGFDLGSDYLFYVGAFSRMYGVNDDLGIDAIIPYAAIEMKGFRIGASYDATISDLQDAPRAVGGLELTLLYIGQPKTLPDVKPVLFCPRY